MEVEEELQLVRRQLQQSMSHESYEKYGAVLEAVASGRLARRELDLCLAEVLPPSLRRTILLTSSHINEIAIHNRYLLLLLEKLTAMEASMAVREEPVIRPARLDPRLLPLSKADRSLISEALARPSIAPLSLEGLREQLAVAILQAERGIGAAPQLSLSCAVSGLIPGPETLTERLALIARTHGLNDPTGSVDEASGRFLEEALEQHLRRLLLPSLLEDGKKQEAATAVLDPTPQLSGALLAIGILP